MTINATSALLRGPFSERCQRVLLRQLRHEAHSAVTIHRLVEFAKRWLYERRILMPDDRRLRGLARSAYGDTEQALRKALRNGSAWIAHSLAFRQRHEMLIPDAEWSSPHRQFYRQLGLPLPAARYTPQLLGNLEAGLASLAEAVEAEATPPLLEATRAAIFKEVGLSNCQN